MAQLLRPSGDVANTWTGTFVAIDEATASDADFVYSANNPNGGGAEFALTDPAATPGSGTCTVRYRYAKVNAGSLDNGGSSVDLAAELRQGEAVVGSASHTAIPGAWTAGSFTLAASAVSDWSTVTLRFTASGGAGNPSSRRGAAVSWAEVEVPDGVVTNSYDLTAEGGSFTLAGGPAVLTYGMVVTATPGAYVLTGYDATLTYNEVTQSYSVTAGAGVFTLSGDPATLARALPARSNKHHHVLRITD